MSHKMSTQKKKKKFTFVSAALETNQTTNYQNVTHQSSSLSAPKLKAKRRKDQEDEDLDREDTYAGSYSVRFSSRNKSVKNYNESALVEEMFENDEELMRAVRVEKKKKQPEGDFFGPDGEQTIDLVVDIRWPVNESGMLTGASFVP